MSEYAGLTTSLCEPSLSRYAFVENLCFSKNTCTLCTLNKCLSLHPELNSGGDGRSPKGTLTEREEKEPRIHSPKLHTAPARAQTNLPPNPCASPKSPHHFVFPYNGSHANSHHPLEALRRVQHPLPLPTTSCSLSSPTLPANTAAQSSPQSSCQGQRTPQTPDTPSSPRLGHLSSPPPPSSPMAMVGGGRGSHVSNPHPHSVIVGSSPISSPSLSPSVHNMSCLSPRQRSRHPSASPSSLSEGGGSAAAAGGGLMGSSLCQRKKSTSSSSPQSPLPSGSPKPGSNIPKFKLDEILEQFKNSGNSSTNNHHILLPTNSTSSTNQSSISNPHALCSKASKRLRTDAPASGPSAFELNATGPSGPAIGPFLNHLQSHQSRLPHPPSFPASSLLSAAAKAQLASQVTQGQAASASTTPVSLPSSLELLKEAQQQQSSSKVTISTLHNSHPSSSTAPARPPHPSLASASSGLFPPSPSLAQSRPPFSPSLLPAAERGAAHRKRQRRSPTVLPQRDTQQLANGLPKTPPGDAVAINLSSSSSFPSSSHSSSTSAAQNQNALSFENHHHHHHPALPGLLPRLPTSRQLAQLSRTPRPSEALDFTTYLTPTPLSLDPPTQPLSALLHLLSVQNAQAVASASSEGGGHTNKASPRLSPSSPSPRAHARQQQTQPPCLNTNPLPLAPPPTAHLRSVQSPTRAPSDQSSPLRRLSFSPTAQPANSSGASQHSSPAPSDKHQSAMNPVTTTGPISLVPPQEASAQGTAAGEATTNVAPSSAEISHSQGSVSVVTSSSPKPLDLSNHVLALLAASSSAAPQGEASTSDRFTDAEMSSQENPAAGKDSCNFIEMPYIKTAPVLQLDRLPPIF